MAIKLSTTQLPQLLSWLQEHLPQSFKLHGELKNHLRSPFAGMDYFVDRWPHPRAAIAVLNSAQEFASDRQIVGGVFSLNDEAVSNMLKDPNVLSWSTGVLFAALIDNQKPALMTLSQEMGKSVTPFPVILLKATAQDLKPIPVPEGMKFKPISSADVKSIHSTWRHREQVSELYVQELVQRFPSLYLVLENGQHVGHMLGITDGTMGMLYVNPEFRRKGYAKVIISQLAQKYFDEGEDAHVFIEEYNVSSRDLHMSLGFKTKSESNYVWLLCE